MGLRIVQNSSLGGQVFRQLASEVLSGRYAPGTTLPSERALSEIFGVNRHAVREATKRLEQFGLVSVNQGGGTRVLDYLRTGGVDLLPMLIQFGGDDDGAMSVWRATLEMRAALGADAARLCAIRADRRLRDELTGIAAELEASIDKPEIMAIDSRFWSRLLDGADNIAYRLGLNSLIKTTELIPQDSLRWVRLELEASEYRMPIARAIADANAEAAEAAARTSLGHLVAIFASIEHAPLAVGTDAMRVEHESASSGVNETSLVTGQVVKIRGTNT